MSVYECCMYVVTKSKKCVRHIRVRGSFGRQEVMHCVCCVLLLLLLRLLLRQVFSFFNNLCGLKFILVCSALIHLRRAF